jgi:glycosyltransferase involved in cell wall biosynthesis
MVDCTINISDAEGFGLATLESLSCGTPIIVNMTGGLQEQVTDGENWFGIGIEPSSKAIIGSQDIPYIYEDRMNKEDFIAALTKMLEMSEEDRKALGEAGREHVQKNYNFNDFCEKWPTLLEDIHNRYGSWEERKNHTTWTFEEVA